MKKLKASNIKFKYVIIILFITISVSGCESDSILSFFKIPINTISVGDLIAITFVTTLISGLFNN